MIIQTLFAIAVLLSLTAIPAYATNIYNSTIVDSVVTNSTHINGTFINKSNVGLGSSIGSSHIMNSTIDSKPSIGKNIANVMSQVLGLITPTIHKPVPPVGKPVSAIQYDKIKNCAKDQSFGVTNYQTYLTHFACGHVTVFNNGTVLRKFTLFVSDYNGSGKAIPISKDVKDPVMFHAWMFNGTVPGPTMRVTEGDHMQLTVVNSPNCATAHLQQQQQQQSCSTFIHSLHMHSIHAGLMDGVDGMGGNIFPGQNYTYNVIAQPAGIYPYHCHMPPVEEHISRGLYGEFIIDPKVPRPPAAEMVMLLNSYTYSYEGVNGSGHFPPTQPANMTQIRNNLSQVEALSDEGNGPDNQFYSVNGMPFGYFGKQMIHLTTGTQYRIYLLNMAEFDPANSFHIHGTMGNFTESGTPQSAKTYTDIVLLQQGDRGIFEFNYKFPGEFMFHSHINHFSDLGWVGFFNVTRGNN